MKISETPTFTNDMIRDQRQLSNLRKTIKQGEWGNVDKYKNDFNYSYQSEPYAFPSLGVEDRSITTNETQDKMFGYAWRLFAQVP